MNDLNKSPTRDVEPTLLVELQRRASTAEEALEEKDAEIRSLRYRLQHFDSVWREYDLKVSSMEVRRIQTSKLIVRFFTCQVLNLLQEFAIL